MRKDGRVLFYVFFALSAIGIVIPGKLSAQSCINQIGIGISASGIRGDIGGGGILPELSASAGILYKRNVSERVALGVAATYGSLRSSDSRSASPEIRLRGLEYDIKFFETTFEADFSFVPFRYDRKKAWSPFMRLSAGAMASQGRKPADRMWSSAGDVYDDALSRTAWRVFPLAGLGFGIKAKLSRRIGVEVYAVTAYTFSDDADMSAPKAGYVYPSGGTAAGITGASGGDWTVRAGIRFGYFFGREDCRCD